MSDDSAVSSLLSVAQDPAEQALAARYAPVICFDAREPFLPLAAGYTIFRAGAASPSFRQGLAVDLNPPGQPAASFAIEYAIWWDWDIGHLYELEHVWVFVDDAGRVVRADASWHGEFYDMRLDGKLAIEGDHVIVYSQPGKHAFASTPERFRARAQGTKRSETKDLAGLSGILIAPYIQGRIQPTPLKTMLVRTFLSQHAFEPAWDFSQVFHFTADMFVPWPALRDWMAPRLNGVLDQLARTIPPAEYRFLRIGHRGARAYAPDNTLLSFRKAAALGADAVECDVQMTADNQIAVSHDDHLVDAAGRVHFIRKSTWAELQDIHLGQGEHLPTLAETLDVCHEERMGTYIEIKDGRCVGPVAALLHERDLGQRAMVGSFRVDWIANFKKLAPDLMTSVLFGSPYLDAVGLARAVGATFVHPCWEWHTSPSTLLTPQWVGAVRAAGMGIICWHEERPQEIAALRRIGVDGICSDTPELLR